MKTKNLVLTAFALILYMNTSSLFAKESSKVPQALALKESSNDKKDLIGSWEIDIPRSLIKLEEIFYKQKVENKDSKSTLSIDRVTADYLFFKNVKDELHYSIKVENLVYVYEMSSKVNKNKKESKNIWMELNLPVDNVIDELLFTNIEALVVQDKKHIPINLEEVMIKKLTVFPKKDSKLKNAKFNIKGNVFDGSIKANGVANPFVSSIPINLNLKLEDLSIDKLNPWLKKAASLKVEKGGVDVFVEFATVNGKIKGYVKFFTEDLELMNEWKDETNFFKNLKMSAFNFGLNLMERTDEDIISGKIKFEGNEDSIDIDFSELFETLVEHFFDGPLKRKYDKSIKLKSL